MNKFIKFISRRSTWSIPYVIFLLLFVVLPLILIGVYAFMDYSGNFTVANFVKFIEQPEAIKTFVYSVAIAIITTFLPDGLLLWAPVVLLGLLVLVFGMYGIGFEASGFIYGGF